jgi:aryl-alcohol dehydrogenase-like predicted oxidoreductase
LRIGLGCMRLPEDEEVAAATVAAATGAGITVFDTARAYRGNESLLARALRDCGAEDRARIVTKGGMQRAGGAWVPDGRAKSLRSDCESSLVALDGLPIDLYLVHAPDPRTPWRTTLRALRRLVDDGLVARVGLANVNRAQLDEALELAPIAAVQVGLSVLDDRALRGGVVERCVEAGITVLAHSPLGGPRRIGALVRSDALGTVADTVGVSPAEVALAWLLALAPNVVAVPGARHPGAARSAARAGRLALPETARESLALEFGRRSRARRAATGGDVVVVMGIPGAGKTRIAEQYCDRGYLRLNRDEQGGSLRDLAGALDDALVAGERQIVLDNTYLTRAARSHVVDAAARHGVRTRCVWVDTPLGEAQVNLVERLLDRFGRLPTPEELRSQSRREAGLLLPTSQMRALRELEPPGPDEGWSKIEHLVFKRNPPLSGRSGVLIAGAVLERSLPEGVLAQADPEVPRLVFDWTRTAGAKPSSFAPPPGSRGPSRLPSAPTGRVLRSAGVVRRSRAFRWRSRANTGSTWRGRPSSV